VFACLFPASQQFSTDECSTAEVTMCRFPGLALRPPQIAALLLSVAHDVKIEVLCCAPINSATCARAVSITPLSFDPNL